MALSEVVCLRHIPLGGGEVEAESWDVDVEVTTGGDLHCVVCWAVEATVKLTHRCPYTIGALMCCSLCMVQVWSAGDIDFGPHTTGVGFGRQTAFIPPQFRAVPAGGCVRLTCFLEDSQLTVVPADHVHVPPPAAKRPRR